MSIVSPQAAPDDSDVVRVPHDRDAEMSALGGGLLTLPALVEVVDTVKAADFYLPQHATVFSAMHDLYGQGQPVDPITVAAELGRRGDLHRIGGAAYLHHLVQAVPTAANAGHYAEIVKERAQKRRLAEEGVRITQMGHNDSVETKDGVESAVAALQSIITGAREVEKLSVADRWEGFLDQLEAGEDPNAISTPWHDLNAVLTLSGPMFVTVGATTGGGKTLLALNLAAHVALKLNRPALVASMEMGGNEILARLTAAEALVPVDRLVRRKLEDSDWDKIAAVSDRIANAHNFVVDDTANLTLSRLRARIRTMAAQGMAPAIVIVDYIQLLTPESAYNGQRAQEVAALSRGLKIMAMEFNTPIVALAQFNRGAVGRRPLLSDFKESSAIEQDSNAVLLLHEERDENDQPVKPGEVELIIAKNRQGAAGRIFPLAVRKHFMRIDSMASS
ncbi:replicative DNA helicase [Streptomyces violascens]|uniref:DNA 5'-3' helicase n=1 Tax=Streptomyces violascens TaxID=67381 RepID=A0ABQ3QL37_9ACTN|nr:DnaB-like helicase C-terminal domain-containing protein [Streptomyces violascens]GGU44830.1 replicative DNA helicase [Streptomyces violascens]GHI37983.1 replicative DNA helicase [Streptomyces violascens]